MNTPTAISQLPSAAEPPPSIPSAMKAKRVTPLEQELPGLLSSVMPTIFVVVARNRQRRRWRVVHTNEQQFLAETFARNLRPSHYQHARVFQLSEK